MCTPAAVTAAVTVAVKPLGASVTVTSLVPSTAYSPTSTSCLTHHCLDSILNILPSSPTGWFNVRASLPPCSASLPQCLRAPSVCTLLPACFNCAALPHHTPCCLEHGRPSRPFIFSIFTVATLFFSFHRFHGDLTCAIVPETASRHGQLYGCILGIHPIITVGVTLP